MLDQNTDRMWYVIGALVVGAGIILLANKALPEVFANVTKSFKGVAEEGISAVENLDNRNYFYLKDFENRMFSDNKNTLFYYIELELEPNTTYTASTNAPISTNEFSSRSVFFYRAGHGPSNDVNGVSDNKTITLTTDDSGRAEVGIRKAFSHENKIYNYKDFLSGDYWLMINKGDEAKPHRLAPEDM